MWNLPVDNPVFQRVTRHIEAPARETLRTAALLAAITCVLIPVIEGETTASVTGYALRQIWSLKVLIGVWSLLYAALTFLTAVTAVRLSSRLDDDRLVEITPLTEPTIIEGLAFAAIFRFQTWYAVLLGASLIWLVIAFIPVALCFWEAGSLLYVMAAMFAAMLLRLQPDFIRISVIAIRKLHCQTVALLIGWMPVPLLLGVLVGVIFNVLEYLVSYCGVIIS